MDTAIFKVGQRVYITAGNGRDGHYAGIVTRVWDMSRKPGPQLYTVVVGRSTYVRSEQSITPEA
jgi:hypothetical protein